MKKPFWEDLPDQQGWTTEGSRFSPLDDEALSAYFDTCRKLADEEARLAFVRAFDAAIKQGWRPKHAVVRAFAALSPEQLAEVFKS
jgi:hypothetical protein